MKVVRCQNKSGLGDGNNTQMAKNKIYDAFAAILGKGKAKSKENTQVKKIGSCFAFQTQVMNRRQSECQERQQIQFTANIQICLPIEDLQSQKDRKSKQIPLQNKYNHQKLSKLTSKGEVTCKKSGKSTVRQVQSMNLVNQQENLWFQDEENNQQGEINLPFNQDQQIKKKVSQEKQLRQCQFIVQVTQNQNQCQLVQKTVKKIKNASNFGNNYKVEVQETADNYEANDVVVKQKTLKSAKPNLRQVEFIVFIEFNKLVQQQQPKKTATCKKSGKGPSPITPPKSTLQYESQNHPLEKSPQINYTQCSQQKLGSANLQFLVKQLEKKQLISSKFAQQFLYNHNDSNIKIYIQLFNRGKLQKFNFSLIKITILDHRRISQLLMSLYPGQYQIGSIRNCDQIIEDFLMKQYAMSGQEYYNLYDQIDKISKIKWWGKILINNEEKMVRINKEKRVAERRAKRAEKAVEEVLKECRQSKPLDIVEIDDDADNQGQDKGPSKMVKLNQ